MTLFETTPLIFMFHKRKFIPTNPHKYTGDVSNIIMRSSWETRFANWCDKNPAVVYWSSEETVIPYLCPTDNKLHRYFIDFKIKIKQKDGTIRVFLIEIKPLKQTSAPNFPGRKTQRYLMESYTFIKNQAKWKAASEYAKDRGWEFKILTENELGITK
jgi:endonuclease YncB( thermonuclease family)